MKQSIRILLLLSALTWAVPACAQCPEDTVDLGECDSLNVICLDCPIDTTVPGPYFVRFPILVTHDEAHARDSIAAFSIPLTWTHTNPSAYCSLGSYWNTLTPYWFVPEFNRSMFRHIVDGTDTLFRNPYADNWSLWWLVSIDVGADPRRMQMDLISLGSRWGEGDGVLLATMTFKLEDTMTVYVCEDVDTTSWPPSSDLAFWRFDAKGYVPRHNLGRCFMFHEVGATAILAPTHIIPADSAITPMAEVNNYGDYPEAGIALFEVGHVYAESVSFNVLPGQEDTIRFPTWVPSEAAAYPTTCTIDPESDMAAENNVFHDMVWVSLGHGPEIHQVVPDFGATHDVVTVAVIGDGFEEGMTARLVLPGEADIVADTAAVSFLSDTTIEITFDLRGAAVDRWDLEVTNAANESYTFYRGFDVIFFDGELLPFCSWEPFSVHDGTSTEIGVAVPDVDDLFLLVKKGGYTIGWWGNIGTWPGAVNLLYHGNEVVAHATGHDDVALHVVNPPVGICTIEISAYGPGSGLIKICSALDTVTLGEWHLGEIIRPYGSDWVQFDVPPGQSSLYLQTEGFGKWSSFSVHYESLSNPTQHWGFSNWGEGYHIEGQIANPPAGRYYLRYMDSAVLYDNPEHQRRQYMLFVDTETTIPPPPSEPVITDLSTYRGGTAGLVTVIISGAGLDSAATVSLVKDECDDVIAEYVAGDSTMRSLAVSFDLSEAELGEWTLNVRNPQGQTATTHRPFTVESGGGPNLWVEVEGRHQARVGRWQTHVVRYGNRGNTDAVGIPLWIIFPNGVNWARGFNMSPPPPLNGEEPDEWENAPFSTTLDGMIHIPLLIPMLPPGFNDDLEISLKLPTSWQGSSFQLKAGLSTPWFSTYNPDSIGFRKIQYVSTTPWWNSKWYDCGLNTVQASLKFPPYLDCLAAELQGLEWIFNDWYRKRIGASPLDPSSFTWQLANIAANCCDEFAPGPVCSKIERINEIHGILEASVACLKAADIWPEFSWLDVSGVGSATPEDKYGPGGYDVPGTHPDSLARYVTETGRVGYRIDFWNKEDATAPAQIVFVEDTLDEDFEPTTFGFTSVGFLRWNVPLDRTQYFNVDVDMRPDDSLIVNIEGTFDPDHRVVKWVFRSLDPITGEPPEDPLAGFLPPIDSTGYNIGWTDFKVELLPWLPTGTQITNQAFVNFDSVGGYNPAPKYAPYLNTIDVGPPASSVLALPDTTLALQFTVSWAGADDSLGSGIRSYSVYYNENGGPYTPWIVDDTTTSAEFTGEDEYTYTFYTIAKDNVGNLEEPPFLPDASTTIIPSGGSISGTVSDSLGGLSGITVDLLDTASTMIGVSNTNESGYYLFDSLLVGSYFVSIVTPSGFVADQETKPVIVTSGADSVVNFLLHQLQIVPSQRSVGYWKHQLNVLLSGKGKAQETLDQMSGYMDRVRVHFNGNGINPITIFTVDQPATITDSLTSLHALLSPNANSQMVKKAEQQLTGLMLNVVSDKLSQTEKISEDSATVSQAITYSYQLICDADSSNDEIAKDIGDKINNGLVVGAEVIPSSTPVITYYIAGEDAPQDRLLPKAFSLSHNYPNPFNPQTVIEYALPHDCEVRITIYNILGQKVRTLVDESQEAGYMQIEWDSKNEHGDEVASGVYFYRIKAGDFTQSKKMVILK